MLLKEIMIAKIGLGGGCHWCTEAVFQALAGVTEVVQGYIKSNPPHDSYSEAVIVHYETKQISLYQLISVHVMTHSSTSNHLLRSRYRSAVYFFDPEQQKEIQQILKYLEKENLIRLVTQILAFVRFKHSRPEIQNYFDQNPEKPFCTKYIHPKLELLKKDFSELVKDNQ